MSRYLPQPYSDDLKAIANLTTNAFGRALLTFQNGNEVLTYIGAASSLASQGSTGLTGATGTAGQAGATGAVGLLWRGTWNAGTIYNLRDVVVYQGSAYLMTLATGGTTASPVVATGNWTLLVSQGGIGPIGSTGPIGATGLAGASGSGNRGPAGTTGPRGFAGSTGSQGASGSTGPDGATGVQGA